MQASIIGKNNCKPNAQAPVFTLIVDKYRLQPWIDRLALEGKNAEHAFMHTVERLLVDEAGKRLHAESKLPYGERTLP